MLDMYLTLNIILLNIKMEHSEEDNNVVSGSVDNTVENVSVENVSVENVSVENVSVENVLVKNVNDEKPVHKHNQKKKLLTVQGYVPLYYAGVLYLTQILIPTLQKSMQTLEFWKTQEGKKNRKFIFVNLPDFRSKLTVNCDDGQTVKSYTLDTLHYAPIKKNSKDTCDRDFDAWKRLNTLSPFRSAQHHMKELGYYLIEDSNSTLGRGIKLYNCEPPFPIEKYWHDHNKIHGIKFNPEKHTEAQKKVNSDDDIIVDNQSKARKNYNRYGNKINNKKSKSEVKLTDEDFPVLPTKSNQFHRMDRTNNLICDNKNMDEPITQIVDSEIIES
jgi:hypothetical protein